jgi:formylmethanofuran dehydrogenase subunit E
MRRTFEEDLAEAVAFHGHFCAGQYLGVRMARIALDHFGIDEPERYRDLICFVENDRCLADAVAVTCHCSLGRRKLKFHDIGKMAATFYDMASGEAIRIYLKGEAHAGPDDDIREFYDRFTDEEFYEVQNVEVHLPENELPGAPRRKIRCEQCGEEVNDGRDVEVDGRLLCKTCAGLDMYYTVRE